MIKKMSVRAYRVNKIEHKKNPSFNLWKNPKLMDFFGEPKKGELLKK